jgi:Zn-dependent alcohol dehydrogenase
MSGGGSPEHRTSPEHRRRFGGVGSVVVEQQLLHSIPVADICGGPADYALECTGVISVVRQAVDSVGMLGTSVLVGGAPVGAEFSADHQSTLWGKTVIGVLGGSGRSPRLIGALMDLYASGRFPFDRLVEYFPLERIQDAMKAAHSGEVIKPILTMPHD